MPAIKLLSTSIGKEGWSMGVLLVCCFQHSPKPALAARFRAQGDVEQAHATRRYLV
jgi:hypothetical protein